MTLRGPFMVSRKSAIRGEPNIRQKITGFTCAKHEALPLPPAPCVNLKRPRVSVQNVPTTPHHTPHTHHNTRHNTPQHTTATRPQQHTVTETCRDRENKRDRERKQRRQDNRREKREERRFIFRVVVRGRSLLMECFVLFILSTPDSLACQTVSSTIHLSSLSAHLGRSTVF